MSHRDEPRSGRGCFGAVVVVPFLALGGMFALIALTGGTEDAPRAAPPGSTRPSAEWWTEPFEALTTSTVTETVVVQGAAREVRAARLATQTRVVSSTVTETVRSTAVKPAATGRNEVPEPEPEESTLPSTSESSAPPVVTSSTVAGPPPVVEPPVTSAPPSPEVPVTEVPPTSTPRAEDPVVTPPVTAPPSVTPPVVPPSVTPPVDRAEPGEPGEAGEEPVPVEVSASSVPAGA